jgi:Tfp pilus assembly protein FimT
VGQSRKSQESSGVSTLELVVALAIIGVVLVILAPRLTSRPLHFTCDLQEFSANLEVTRVLARSRTGQYRLRVVSASQYVIERGVLGGGVWTFPTTERTVTLRSGVRFAAASVGQAATFDSRGRLGGANTTFIMEDGARGWSRQVLVRTTGMVEAQ